MERPFFSDSGWMVPDEAIQLNELSWRPDFIREGEVMCLITAEEIPAYLVKRIRAARLAGLRVYCVTDLEVLSNSKSVALLSEVDANICYVSDDGTPGDPKKLLKVLGEEEIPVDTDRRLLLVRNGIERCLNETDSNEKGKNLEVLLHFMFSQIADFRVLRCNWRTKTEELDCVIQIRSSTSDRCWAGLAAPIVIVEGKNRKDKSGQENVSKLRTIMHGKRRTCRIGFLISISGFTSDAHNQVLRFSSEENIFVLLDRADLEEWGESTDFDEALEGFVTKAMLD